MRKPPSMCDKDKYGLLFLSLSLWDLRSSHNFSKQIVLSFSQYQLNILIKKKINKKKKDSYKVKENEVIPPDIWASKFHCLRENFNSIQSSWFGYIYTCAFI